MAWVPYDNAKLIQYNGNALNFGPAGDTLKCMLVTSGYTPNRATHQYITSASGSEVTGGNYTAGGATLGSKTLAVASNTLTFDCADITWLQHATGFTTARIAVLYHDSGVPGTSELIAYYDLVSDRGNVDGDLKLETPNGIFTV